MDKVDWKLNLMFSSFLSFQIFSILSTWVFVTNLDTLEMLLFRHRRGRFRVRMIEVNIIAIVVILVSAVVARAEPQPAKSHPGQVCLNKVMGDPWWIAE
jgi:hypothetical protein